MPRETRTPRLRTSKASRHAALSAAIRVLDAAPDGNDAEPLLVLWKEWRAAFPLSEHLCREAQQLERYLIGRIGLPAVEIPMSDPERPMVRATDPRQIDRVLGTAPARLAQRRRLKRALRVARARWNAEAAACGLTAAIRSEVAADHRVDELLRIAAVTPAHSLMGAIAKLVVIEQWGEREPEGDDLPWPFLRSVLSDLVTLAAEQQQRPTLSG
ncbi:hypothetical protein ACIC2N_28280 [Azospirillum argentinense]